MAGEKIIIVDDEADVLDLCSRILAADGYQIRTAPNGYEAIDIATQEHFDLLLTDVKMPGLTGLEIAQTLKKHDPNIICVTMTGYSTIDMVIEALRLGVDEFITKPFSTQELSLIIAKALEKERLRKENFRLRSLIPLFELNKTLLGTVEVDQVMRRLLEIAQEETQADLAVLYLFNEARITKRLQHPVKDTVDQRQTNACNQLAQLVFTGGQQLILNNGEVVPEEHREIVTDLDTRAILATPLKSQSNILGVLILGRKERSFTPSDSEFSTVLAGQASIALENARLFSEIQEAYEELRMLDHMKSEFINIAAHELRTPLAILMGYGTLLEDESSGLQRDYVANIMRNAMRLRSLIDDMLSLQYLESGVASLTRDRLSLQLVLEEIIQDMSLMIEEKKLKIQIQIPEDFPPIVTDSQKLDLIIMNLFHNAIKFTPAEGAVTFDARIEGDRAVMSVSDTGIGIPADKLNRVFDRFYQVEQSLTREYGGIGLGLAITKGMVEVCGGDIWVESKEGEGTTFTFTLPVDNTQLEPRPLYL
jgi:signal transduction histidine kinase